MTIEAEHDAPAPTRGRRNLGLLAVGAVVVVLVVLVAALGGFNDVAVEKLPVIALGDTYAGTEVETRVTGTYLTGQQPGYTFDADEGMQYFVVQATLLNTDKDTDVLDTGLIRILLGDAVAPGDQPKGVLDADKNQAFGFLQPGLPVHVLYFWQVPDSIGNGDEVIVGVFDRHLVVDPRLGGKVYSSGEPVARIVTTIGERS